MSDSDRSRIKPPRLHITYDAIQPDSDDGAAGGAEVSTGFRVEYHNNAAVPRQFWRTWAVCMTLFMLAGAACALVRWHFWRVRSTNPPLRSTRATSSFAHG